LLLKGATVLRRLLLIVSTENPHLEWGFRKAYSYE